MFTSNITLIVEKYTLTRDSIYPKVEAVANVVLFFIDGISCHEL